MEGVTPYSGLSRFYFRRLLERIRDVGELHRPGIRILDFGCGEGELKRLCQDASVIGYDIIRDLSDVDDWSNVEFDILVANQVFCTFSEVELESILLELKAHNSRLELIVGISRQGLLNKIGKYLLGRPNAHASTKLQPKQELAILKKHCRILRHEGVMNLADVYLMALQTPEE